jgi:hypothetical protein
MATGLAARGGISDLAQAQLTQARRHARGVLAVLWLAFLGGTLIWTNEVTFGVMVLLVGISSVLESVHGALALERALRRLVS